MEYLVAALVLTLAIAYAVVIAVNIEKGKSWAMEIARAISMLDPQAVSCELRSRALEAPALDTEVEPVQEAEPERLAA